MQPPFAFPEAQGDLKEPLIDHHGTPIDQAKAYGYFPEASCHFPEIRITFLGPQRVTFSLMETQGGLMKPQGGPM